MKKRYISCSLPFIAVLLFISCKEEKVSEKKDLSLNALFSDHMVLQQQDDVTFWGEYIPSQKVTVSGSWGEEVSASANSLGQWSLKLKTPRAGGPFDLTITTQDSTITLNDILVGEVWLASGQSNMEMPLKGFLPNDPIDNSEEEIAAANYPQIRYFDIPTTVASSPENKIVGQWQSISPETAAQFSAAGYFFARKLHQELDVPIGIITSNWGGTPVESWMSREKILELGEFEKELESIKEENTAIFKKWYAKFPTVKVPSNDKEWETLNLEDAVYNKGDFNDSNWGKTALPAVVENLDVYSNDGIYWFRKKVVIDDPSSDYTFKVSWGIDDSDITYVNGQIVGSTFGYNVPRSYSIPSSVLIKGENIIAVRVVDTGGGGGFIGTVSLTNNNTGAEIDITDDWRFEQIAGIQSSDFLLFHKNQDALKNPPAGIESFKLDAHTPSALFNSMINPLIPYTIKGAIWYQGEGNVGRDEQYLKLFPGMIEDWRERWNDDFSFYFVQIAPFSYGSEQSPALRDAQRKTLKLPKTGMAITMDIGMSESIHPGNKQDVGHRLARLALANDYNKDIIASGPLYRSHSVSGNTVTVEFDYAESGLMAKSNDLTGFEIAGSDNTFVAAKAKIVDHKVEVSATNITEPKHVRYAWKDFIDGTFFNNAGLPASSFSTN